MGGPNTWLSPGAALPVTHTHMHPDCTCTHRPVDGCNSDCPVHATPSGDPWGRPLSAPSKPAADLGAADAIEIGEPGGRDEDYRVHCGACGSDRFEIYYDPIAQGRSVLCARCGSAFPL